MDQVIQNKLETVRCSQQRGRDCMQDEAVIPEEVSALNMGCTLQDANEGGKQTSGNYVEEAMILLQEWKWPYMGCKPVWDLNGILLPPTLLATRCLAMMTTIVQRDNFTKLSQLIADILTVDPGCSIPSEECEVDSLEGINTVLDIMEGKEALHDFIQLRALVHLVIRIDE